MDTPDPSTGLIDGIVPLSSLPISTLKEGKVTILVTAKKYIDHLDKERRKTERARKGLEEFIKKIEGGREALRGWREVSSEVPSFLLRPRRTIADQFSLL